MIYGYCRVSTFKQLNQNGIEAQRTKLLEAGAQKILLEQYTGSTTKRPVLNKLIKDLKKNDTLIVTSLDRIARNVKEGIILIEELINKDVNLNILNLGMLDNKPISKFIINVLLAVAELEKNIILERMQQGMEIAKTKEGFRIGRPPISKKKKKYAAKLVVDEKHTYKEAIEITGLSKTTIINAVKAYKAKINY